MSSVIRALAPIPSERALRAAARAFSPRLQVAARKIARGNLDLADDLEQEALIRLWELDPTRFDYANAEDRLFIHRALVNRMRDVAKHTGNRSLT
jgi:DNA-directed RNA polymerase specialized sigma24 family protein